MADLKFNEGSEDFQQAEWLTLLLDGTWKYDFSAEQWHHFDGVRWAPDQKNELLYEVASLAARALDVKDPIYVSGETERKARMRLLSIASQKKAIEALATFPGYGTNGDEWDTNPYLLGTPNGIVDLRENAIVPANPEQNVTKTTDVEFHPVAGPDEFKSKHFMRVLSEWMSGDEDMMYFLLFWFGASLFGMSPEQRFLLMTGRGRNGKGALKHAVLKATGDYSDELDPSLYMRSRHGGARSNEARADLINLKGLRITFFSEPSGGQFNEELLKAHTGSDRISARALYSNNVQSWEATHSINFLTNDLPAVEDVGPSMGERVMVADFRESYEGDKRDVGLYEKLAGKLEREAILSILVWASSIWHARWSGEHGGLVLPERVVEQSKEFIERNDPVSNWLNDRCERGRELQCNSQLAYDSYVSWHVQTGAPGEVFSMVKWAATLGKKGYTKQKTRTANVWTGFRMFGAMELADRGLDEDEEP